jgi:hypothetical protein
MTRTFVERWRESPGQQALEQFVLHPFAVGAPPPAFVLGFGVWGFTGWQVAAGAAAAAWVAGIRFYDGWPVGSWGDEALDFVTTTLGGVIVGGIAWLVT